MQSINNCVGMAEAVSHHDVSWGVGLNRTGAEMREVLPQGLPRDQRPHGLRHGCGLLPTGDRRAILCGWRQPVSDSFQTTELAADLDWRYDVSKPCTTEQLEDSLCYDATWVSAFMTQHN